MLSVSEFIKQNTWSLNTRTNTEFLIDKNATSLNAFNQFSMLIRNSEGQKYHFEGYVYMHVPAIGRMKNQIIYRYENLSKEKRTSSC